jgi:hypothetical protein
MMVDIAALVVSYHLLFLFILVVSYHLLFLFILVVSRQQLRFIACAYHLAVVAVVVCAYHMAVFLLSLWYVVVVMVAVVVMVVHTYIIYQMPHFDGLIIWDDRSILKIRPDLRFTLTRRVLSGMSRPIGNDRIARWGYVAETLIALSTIHTRIRHSGDAIASMADAATTCRASWTKHTRTPLSNPVGVGVQK